MSTTAPHVTVADRARLEWYLLRLDAELQDYPGRRRRQVLRELRAEALAAAPEAGMRAVLADLGSARLLAARYLSELERPVPRWSEGAAVAALVAVGLPMYLWAGYMFGATEALDAVGGGNVAYDSFLGATIETAVGDGSFRFSQELHGGWLVTCAVVGAVVFLTAARAWRALPR